jgi:palmitoyltransferase
MLAILLVRTVYGMMFNITTIESWEMERHATLARRARLNGGWVDGQAGQRVRLVKREFPYDVGIWRNVVIGMGTANVLSWGNVFARTLKGVGIEGWEVNGFEDKEFVWPPPDPDRMPRPERSCAEEDGIMLEDGREGIEAFKKRQQADYQRFERPGKEQDEDQEEDDESDVESEDDILGRAWRNSDGERLRDFGVDEDVEFEEDIPLGELIRRRKARELEAD